jgi:glutamine synthetase
VTIHWADNNGIPSWDGSSGAPRRSGSAWSITALFAVFDSRRGHLRRAASALGRRAAHSRTGGAHPLAGRPALAWVPGRQVAADGSRGPTSAACWTAQVAALAGRPHARRLRDGVHGVHRGLRPPTRSGLQPHALMPSTVRRRRSAAAPPRPPAGPAAPVRPGAGWAILGGDRSGDRRRRQLLARQTLRVAAERHGLRLSFAPLPALTVAGNGWHIHSSVWRDGVNLLAGTAGSTTAGPGVEGAAYIAGILRDLPAVAAVTAPSLGSLARLRPGYFAGASAFWGVENREAPLRYVPGSPLLGSDHANVELKTSDASANPYLAVAAVLAAGGAGVAEKLEPAAVRSDRAVDRRRARRARHPRPACFTGRPGRRRCGARAWPTRWGPGCWGRFSRCDARTTRAAARAWRSTTCSRACATPAATTAGGRSASATAVKGSPPAVTPTRIDRSGSSRPDPYRGRSSRITSVTGRAAHDRYARAVPDRPIPGSRPDCGGRAGRRVLLASARQPGRARVPAGVRAGR